MKGQGLIEYAIILILITIVVIAVLYLLGPELGVVLNNLIYK